MEKKKGSLSIVFLVIAIILIIVMGAFMYIQKTEADRQIAELENNASKLEETINDLQGKIDSISNTINGTTEEIKFDTIIELNEIESLDYSNKSQLKNFHSKYEGKTVKITGYVKDIEDNVIVTSVDTAETVVHIGNATNDENWIVSGSSANLNVRKQINNLKSEQKVSIIGVINKDAQPIEVKDIKIIVEQEDGKVDEITKRLENNDVLSVTDAIKNNNGTYTLKGKIITVDTSKEQITEYPFYKETGEYKQITVSADTKCVYSLDSNEFKTDTVENVFSKKLYFGGCFNFTFENGKCISVNEIVTGH